MYELYVNLIAFSFYFRQYGDTILGKLKQCFAILDSYRNFFIISIQKIVTLSYLSRYFRLATVR